MTEREFKDQIEGYIDRQSLSVLLSLVEEICREKAEHVLTNWQDKAMSKAWEHNARTVSWAQSKVKDF